MGGWSHNLNIAYIEWHCLTHPTRIWQISGVGDAEFWDAVWVHLQRLMISTKYSESNRTELWLGVEDQKIFHFSLNRCVRNTGCFLFLFFFFIILLFEPLWAILIVLILTYANGFFFILGKIVLMVQIEITSCKSQSDGLETWVN